MILRGIRIIQEEMGVRESVPIVIVAYAKFGSEALGEAETNSRSPDHTRT